MWGWAELNSSAGMLTTNAEIECSWRLAIYRESTCYATNIECDCHLRLATLWGRIGRSMHHYDCCFMHNYASLSFVLIISNLWSMWCYYLLCVKLDKKALFHATWIAVLEDSVWLLLPYMFASKGIICLPYMFARTFGEETLSSLTTSRPPLGAQGLAWAVRLPIYANTLA
jgi:hypothetical protein